MNREPTRVATLQSQPHAVPSSRTGQSAQEEASSRDWSGRIYDGLRVRDVSPEIHGVLVQATGEIGTEAEFYLSVLAAFLSDGRANQAVGDRFLRQIEMSAYRLATSAELFEIAVQSYLRSVELLAPGMRERVSAAPVWWTDRAWSDERDVAIEMRLRACGYPYRVVVGLQLPVHIESMAQQLALVLHALQCMPPAGVLPFEELCAGLYELASIVQGDVALRHIRDVSSSYPGLLSSIAQLRAFAAQGDCSLASDIAWAQAQYASVVDQSRRLSAQRLAPQSPGQAGLLDWTSHAAHEWMTVIRALEQMRVSQTPSVSTR